MAPTTTNWLFDSGASFHATNDLNNLSIHAPYDGTEELVIGDGLCLQITHICFALIHTLHTSFILKNDRETKILLFKGMATKGLYELRSSLTSKIFEGIMCKTVIRITMSNVRRH
ncbi:hypothetical protein OSB04_017257 [Centaurea solstitialis]|uniref:Uncharacterized protein n=1 Tax=Centaurea solstitialis TaxID=347529 RepID=A0AA38TKN3_9ASTR|nr:hypothetical protein OSB04_017257 [Centaurea solstitialis]